MTRASPVHASPKAVKSSGKLDVYNVQERYGV